MFHHDQKLRPLLYYNTEVTIFTNTTYKFYYCTQHKPYDHHDQKKLRLWAQSFLAFCLCMSTTAGDLQALRRHQNKNRHDVTLSLSLCFSAVPPEVSLFQKDSSSPVVCHATGFFPKSVMISWQKNGEDLNEDVELRETLPNQDGTFQKRSILTVSPEELKNNQYTCVIQHSSLEKALVLLGLIIKSCQVEEILSGVAGNGVSVGLIVGVMVGALLLVIIICAAVFIWKRRSSGE
uniref:Ig-like domain-containing protein n=1 Tax=Astyanax mexicanus TaxID=7994 RepID=A0A3B1K207_ASTMX